ncbi:unnamed protein product [Dicrocoelium dendriticum]|nr:unnamed protein product [Dicrocoelium dendriticum]
MDGVALAESLLYRDHDEVNHIFQSLTLTDSNTHAKQSFTHSRAGPHQTFASPIELDANYKFHACSAPPEPHTQFNLSGQCLAEHQQFLSPSVSSTEGIGIFQRRQANGASGGEMNVTTLHPNCNENDLYQSDERNYSIDNQPPIVLQCPHLDNTTKRVHVVENVNTTCPEHANIEELLGAYRKGILLNVQAFGDAALYPGASQTERGMMSCSIPDEMCQTPRQLILDNPATAIPCCQLREAQCSVDDINANNSDCCSTANDSMLVTTQCLDGGVDHDAVSQSPLGLTHQGEHNLATRNSRLLEPNSVKYAQQK